MGWKLNLRFIFTFAWYYRFRIISRGPSYLIANISTPLTLLFLVFVLSHGELVHYAIAGGFLTLIASVALQSSGDAAFMRLQLRIQELFVATSVSSADYMIGLTLSERYLLLQASSSMQSWGPYSRYSIPLEYL